MSLLTSLTTAGATDVWMLDDTATGLPKNAENGVGAKTLLLPTGVTKSGAPVGADTGFNVPDAARELLTNVQHVGVTKRSYTFAIRTTDTQGCVFSSRRSGVTDQITITGWIGPTGAGWGTAGRLNLSVEGPGAAWGRQTQASLAIADGNWHVVTMILDGVAGPLDVVNDLFIMVDGALAPLDTVSVASIPTLPVNTANPMAIGANHVWSGRDLNADFGFFAVHDGVAVTLLQHQQIVAATNELATPPVVAPTVTAVRPLGTGVWAEWVNRPEASQGYEYRINGGTPVAVAFATTEVVLLTGLTNGTTHTFEVRSKNLNGTGPWSTPRSFTPAAPYAFDRFNRTNVAPSGVALGAPEQGAATWTQPVGALGILDGQAYATAAADNLAIVPAAYDLDIEIRLGTTINGDVVFRYRNTTNYCVYFPKTGRMLRRIGGQFYDMMTIGITHVPGQRLRIVAIGEGIRLYVDGVLVRTAYDAWSVPSTDTFAGTRLDDSTGRVDWALIGPVDPIDAAARPAGVPDVAVGAGLTQPTGFVYKGRDSKTADTGSVA